MTCAFCPGHVTCFFHPVRTGDPETTGSRGAGLRLSAGTQVIVEERTDRRVRIVMDGSETDAPVSRKVIDMMCPDRGLDVTITNDLPVGQGFGMSASGAIALALALCALTGRDPGEAYRYAHVAEVVGGGGLGDVAAIASNRDQPVRIRPGLPPVGEVVGTGIRFERLTLAVIGDRLSTGPIIADPGMQRLMNEVGSRMVDDYVSSPSPDSLFAKAREFSSSVGLESPDVRAALGKMDGVAPAGMCMLGHSIFTTLPEDDAKEILGDVPVYSVSTSSAPALIRRV